MVEESAEASTNMYCYRPRTAHSPHGTGQGSRQRAQPYVSRDCRRDGRSVGFTRTGRVRHDAAVPIRRVVKKRMPGWFPLVCLGFLYACLLVGIAVSCVLDGV